MVKDPITGEENDNPMSRFINAPGGLTREEALQRAQDSIEIIRADAVQTIDAAVLRIGELIAQARVPTHAEQVELHRRANDVLTLGGMFDRTPLAQAAYSFCELIDELATNGLAWDREAARVHYEAMLVLRTPAGVPESEQRALIDGLRRVTQRASAPRHAAN